MNRPRKVTTESVERELLVELRGIFRALGDLRQPLSWFREIERPSGGPRFQVILDPKSHWQGSGVRTRITQTFGWPDERLIGLGRNTAMAIWHLKDRFDQLAKRKSIRVDVEKHAKASSELMILADISNRAKHGGHDNRSGRDPFVGIARLDLGASGEIEFRYDGASKSLQLLVSEPSPIRVSLPVIANYKENWNEPLSDHSATGELSDIAQRAMICWRTLMSDHSFLSAAGESGREQEFVQHQLTSLGSMTWPE